MRLDFPPNLPADEERAIIAALEEYFRAVDVRPSPWALAGRGDALRLGAVQIRHQSRGPWNEAGRGPFAHKGTDARMGRGDSK
jgi:hypothetical protein